MLKAIKELLVGTRDMPTKPTASTSSSRGPAGYYMPASAEQLLSTAPRKQCLQQLWENCALPKDLYEQFYLQPLKQLMTLMQVLPATLQGEYAREGGLIDVTLQTTTYAVRLAKGHMLPPGAAPEEQSAPECTMECRGVLRCALALPAVVEPAAGGVPEWSRLVTRFDGTE